MNGKKMIYIDQYGFQVFARTRDELVRKAGGGRISKMYRNKKDGSVVHVGYVVGPHWFEAFQPVENPT